MTSGRVFSLPPGAFCSGQCRRSHLNAAAAVRALGVAIALVVGSLLVPAGAASAPETPTGAGAGGLHHAGLVIRHGDGRVTYAYIAFPEEELNGIALLQRSGVEAVTIPFGGLGEGICMLEGEGCGVADCRRLCQTGGRDSPYWRYFGRGNDGSWVPFELGASGAKVHDGDVQLWSWSPDEPKMPPVTLAEVAERAGAPAVDAVGTVWLSTDGGTAGRRDGGEDDQGWAVYLAAGGVLGVIGVGTGFAVWRGRRQERAA